jgi:hypothetical protein
MVQRVQQLWPSFPIPGNTPDRLAEIGPRARPRLRPEADPLEWRELAIVAAVAMLLGFVHGAAAVVGPVTLADPEILEASTPSEAAGSLEADSVRGPFWRPAGSTAQRPQARLEPVLWQPEGSDVMMPAEVGAAASH